MGYRSEVILAVGPEVMPQFMVTMAKSPQAREMCWADHDGRVSSGMNLTRGYQPFKISSSGVMKK